MNILILEDERRVARQLEKMVRQIIGRRIKYLKILDELDEAIDFLSQNTIDLLFLDLNLNEEDGFDLLRSKFSGSFNTIITSAYSNKAIDAFDLGVIDFVPKPFLQERLEKAIQRHFAHTPGGALRYIVVKGALENRIIDLQKLIYIEGHGKHSKLNLITGEQTPHHKSLDQMQQLLPPSFERVHKSFIANMDLVKDLQIQVGSKYSLVMLNEEFVPVGRVHYKRLKGRFI